jgi:Right handed beta helix region
VIRDNVVRGNGFGHPIQGDVWGAGIRIDQSRDVRVYGNTVEDNAAGITATQEPAGDQCGFGSDAEVANLYVHDNTVVQPAGIAAGLRLMNDSDQTAYTALNNRWQDNQYSLGNPSNGPHFFWANAKINSSAWQSYGQS